MYSLIFFFLSLNWKKIRNKLKKDHWKFDISTLNAYFFLKVSTAKKVGGRSMKYEISFHPKFILLPPYKSPDRIQRNFNDLPMWSQQQATTNYLKNLFTLFFRKELPYFLKIISGETNFFDIFICGNYLKVSKFYALILTDFQGETIQGGILFQGGY